ncbi:MAG: hypothetical protein IJH78_04055 [Clostridia bacterium]|nr:hypothetical protein [Clostridia bacterium]
MKVIKAHCPKEDKWFVLPVDDEDRVEDLIDIEARQAEHLRTRVKGTRFFSCEDLQPCLICGSRHVGGCDHIEQLGWCGVEYSFQCLYCSRLRISYAPARPHVLIPGRPVRIDEETGSPNGEQDPGAEGGPVEVSFT